MIRLLGATILFLSGTASLATAQVFEDRLVTPQPAASAEDFGESVAIDGATLAVGACRGDRVVLFERSLGRFAQTQILSGQDSQAGDEFGASVALRGDTLAVGAPFHVNALNATGAVYVFTRTNGTWTESAKLLPSDGQSGDAFGTSLDLDGTRCLVGAPVHDPGSGFGAGAAYVFEGAGSSWNEETKLVANDGAVFDFFGFDLALSGENAVIGAEFDDDQGMESGAAYVFNRTGTSWAQVQKLLASDGTGEALFGVAVDIDGERLIVGAPRDFTGVPDRGAAYIFELIQGTWVEIDILRGAATSSGDNFGVDVALEGDVALIGAYLADAAPFQPDSGAAYAFRESGGPWVEEASFLPSDPSPDANFGRAAALFGATIVLGAPRADSATPDGGAVYVYEDSLGGGPIFCEATGGGLNGCTSCPCGNENVFSVGGCLNSFANSAVLMVEGQASVSFDTLRLDVSFAIPNSFGVLLSGDSRLPANPSNPCFGLATGVLSPVLDGKRCVGVNVQRHGTRATDGAGSIGRTTPAWGFPNGPVGGLIAQGGFTAGTTRHFQAFYRDNPRLGCGTGQNSTQGVSVVFLP